MELSTLTPALLGGATCGLAAVGLMASHGRIAGISGLFGSAAAPGRVEDRASRWAFLAGLVAVGLGVALSAPDALAIHTPASASGIVLAGALVGAGSRLANGCTSGHGVCGLGRLSPRSLVAVNVFCIAGALSLYATGVLFGGAS